MVTRLGQFLKRNRRGSLIIEMIVGMAFLIVAILPLAFSFAREERFLRTSYLHAVALQVVDGEMEILAAGEWQSFPAGTQTYKPAKSTANLPDGTFTLTIEGKYLRLDWQAAESAQGGKVVREVTLK